MHSVFRSFTVITEIIPARLALLTDQIIIISTPTTPSLLKAVGILRVKSERSRSRKLFPIQALKALSTFEPHDEQAKARRKTATGRVRLTAKLALAAIGAPSKRIFTFCDHLDVFLYIVSVTAAIAAGATIPLTAIVFGSFTTSFNNYSTGDSLSAQEFRNITYKFVLYYVYLFVARLIVSYVANVAGSIAGIRVTRGIRKQFLRSTLRQEVDHFENTEGNGSIAAQVTTNGNRINQGIAEKLILLIRSMSLFLSSFIVALTQSWELALITMTIIPAIFLMIGICLTIEVRLEKVISDCYSQSGVLAQETFGSIRTIQAFWAHEKMVRRYNEYMAKALKTGVKRSINGGIAGGIFQFCVFSGSALAFWEGFRLYESGAISSVGNVLAVIMSITSGVTSVVSFPPLMTALSNAAAAADELFAVIDKHSELDALSDDGDAPHECAGTLELQNVTFAYPSRPSINVLNKFNLSIPAGKTTALVGASGCGKSTVIALLERWYTPNSGDIYLDDQDVAQYNLTWLRSRMRLVQQEPVLFRGTVFQNVAKGFLPSQLELSQEQQLNLVQAACKQSNAHDFVQALPKGYQTEVGERASMLSGGQKQRLAIARSIISDPQILLLDEATSALDTRAESVVQDALNKVSRDKTTLVIAHKLSTIRGADKIVVMGQGEVIEQGTHRDLLEANGQYAALVRAQDLQAGRGNSKAQHDGVIETEVDAFAATSKGIVEESSKDSELAPHTNSLGYSLLHCIWIMLGEQKDLYWWYLGLLVACVVGGGTYPAQAVLFAELINVFTLSGQEAVNRANFFALMFFVFAIANFLVQGVFGGVGVRIAQEVTCRYRVELFKRILYMDQEFFDMPENSSGALSSRLSSVPDAVMELLSQHLLLIIMCVVNLGISSILAIAYGWKLGLVVVFTAIPVFLICGKVRLQLERKFEQNTNERFAESAALATEAVTNIRTIASLTLERGMCKQYNDSLDKISKGAFMFVSYTSLAYALSQSFDFLLMALGFGYGAQLIASGEYTVMQFYVVFMAVLFGGQAAGQIFGYIPSMSRAQLAANYVLWVRSLKPSIAEDGNNKNVGPHGDEILKVENVHFRYKQRSEAPVLNGITMNIRHGSTVAVVGPSGCGKSTLISLLERLYDPISGNISLGTAPITTMSPRLYRSHISLVQQEPTLYSGSVRDNITIGLASSEEDSIPDSAILAACRAAHAFDFIASLPEGLSTACGAKGLQFSGGQRQRIAIARALIREPRILLLDEATSALDTQSERIVQSSLNEAARVRTTIAVAHRLSTIKHADIIFVFDKGRIVEYGTHEELVAYSGRYWEMCVSQAVGDDSS